MDSVELVGDRCRVIFDSAMRNESADPYARSSFVVEVTADGLVARRTVVMFTFDWETLAAFFSELATSWRGWEGTKDWVSVERDVAISATADHLGHRTLVFVLRDWRVTNWKAEVSVTMAGGEDMATAARSVHRWIEG